MSSKPLAAIALLLTLATACSVGAIDGPADDRDDVEKDLQSLHCSDGDTSYHPSSLRCGGIPGAYTASSANIGYYPVVALRDTPLYSGDFGPGLGATLLRTVGEGEGFAIQSTRNPTCSDAPPMRPTVNGFVYGLTRSGSVAGWIRLADVVSVGSTSQALCADGPGSPGTDFQVAYDAEHACRAFHCDSGRKSCRSANAETDGRDDCTGGSAVDWQREVAADTLHLRFAQGSTSIGYAHRHDRVRVLFVNGAWAFVEITASTCPSSTPVGMRAWTMLEFLAPISSDPPSTPPPPAPDPGGSPPPADPDPDPGTDPDPGVGTDPTPAPTPPPAPRYCCAKCSKREVYHRVDVASGCTDAARAYCKVNDRGSFQDAMWGDCAA